MHCVFNKLARYLTHWQKKHQEWFEILGWLDRRGDEREGTGIEKTERFMAENLM